MKAQFRFESGPSVLLPLGFLPASVAGIAPNTTPWIVVPDERAVRRMLAPDGAGCLVSQARVLTVERMLSECLGFSTDAPGMPKPAERFLLMGAIAKAAGKKPNAGLVETILAVERLGHEGLAPKWMGDLIAEFRRKLAERGKCSHRERLDLVLRELSPKTDSPLVRHLISMVRVVRIEGFDFIDGDIAELAKALAEHVHVELRVPPPLDQNGYESLVAHFRDNLGLKFADLGEIHATRPLYDANLRVVRLRQSFQQPLWVAAKVKDILAENRQLPSIAIVVPSSAHAERVRLALELAGIPVSCPAESTILWDTRPGQFFRRILDFPAMPLLADIDRIAGDPWARESFRNFWLWPTLRRLCGEYRTGLSPDDWADFLVAALEKWASNNEAKRPDGEKKDPVKPFIRDEFVKQSAVAEKYQETNSPRSEGAETAETEEPAQAASKVERALQMAALAVDLVKVMKMAGGARRELPSGSNGTRELARRLGELLDKIGISKKLSGFRRGALPAGAMETDQKAAAKIREALKGLFRADIATECLSVDQAINLAMAAQRVRLSPRDSGCVQVLSPAMAAGEPFDHVLVVGMESGCYESSLPDPSLCPTAERKRVRNQLASHLKRTCCQARRAVWLVWSEADKEQKQVRGSLLDEIEETYGSSMLPELVPDEVLFHRKPVDSFRIENANSWSERLALLSRPEATSAALPGCPSWLPSVMELAWPRARHFSPTGLQNHHKCRYMFFSGETVGCRGFELDGTAKFEGNYMHKIMELAVKETLVFPPSRDSINLAAQAIWPEYREVLAPEMESLGTQLAVMLEKCKELEGVAWHAKPDSLEKTLAFEMKDADGEPFWMRLRMDTILGRTLSSDSRLIVLDYKRSMPSEVDRQVSDGTLLEPLVYLEAVRQCKGIAHDRVDMALLQLKPNGSAKLQWVYRDNHWLTGPSGKPVPPVEDLLAIVSRSVFEVRKGVYGLTVLDSGKHPSSPCSGYCQSRHVCRYLRQPVKLVRGS